MSLVTAVKSFTAKLRGSKVTTNASDKRSSLLSRIRIGDKENKLPKGKARLGQISISAPTVIAVLLLLLAAAVSGSSGIRETDQVSLL